MARTRRYNKHKAKKHTRRMRRKVKKHSRRMRRKSSFRKTKHKKKRGGAPGEEEEAADDPPPPDGAWQMVHQDPANKKGKRVFCEGKLGTITDAKDDSMGSYCKIQYDNGTTTNKNANDGYLRFANASGMSNPTILCFTNNKPPLIPSPNTLKSDSGQFERCECLNWDGDEPITQEPLNGYKCEELILLPSKNCMTKDAVDNMVKRVDPYNRESFG